MLFQLMQQFEVDLGEACEADGSSVDIRDGVLTTRMIVCRLSLYIYVCVAQLISAHTTQTV